MTPLALFHAPRERLDVTASDGQLLASYRFGPDLQRPHLHPLAPPGAPPITLCGPHDHIWHHGLFLAWKFVDGRDFWQGSGGRSVSGPLEVVEHRDDQVGWTHEVTWRGEEDGLGEHLMAEQREVTVRLVDTARLAIGWSSTFEVERPIRLHADERGYGGLGIRLIRDLQLEPRLATAEGEAGADAVRGTRSPWASWYGRSDENGEWMGVTLFDAPANPGHPSPVFVPMRQALVQMAFLSSGFVFSGEHVIEPGHALTLRYGVLLHRGEPPDVPGTWQGWFGTDEQDEA